MSIYEDIEKEEERKHLRERIAVYLTRIAFFILLIFAVIKTINYDEKKRQREKINKENRAKEKENNFTQATQKNQFIN